ncbi:hypothetical protein FSARC_7660 [Fusarium sarcochroum]|uniref:Reverse transcriptase domain-containing protein n=1 Tax=Fusarium sarcochroum TaxID=1208366 RepID=A0A8H4TUM7_9HYPO|nr:hypothetical protein FSARC_7660 [Fusarium sarcochroum]
MRFGKLVNGENTSQNGLGAHVMCLRVPTLAVAWSRKFHYVMGICPSRPLLEADDPREKRRKRQMAKKETEKETKRKAKGLPTPDVDSEQEPKEKPISLSRVSICVHKSIPSKNWRVEYHDDLNQNLAATLYLRSKVGEIAIHNIQNLNTTDKKIDVDLLTQRTSSGLHVVLGDFNLHHKDWGGDILNPAREGTRSRELSDKMKKAEMKLITEPGTITYTRGAAKDGTNPSCIDLTFVSKDLQPRVASWGVDKVSCWEESDHRPIRTVLNIQPFDDQTRRYQFNKAAVGALQKDLAESMVELIAARLQTNGDLDVAAEEFVSILKSSIDRCIPTRLANPPPKGSKRTDAIIRATAKNGGISIADPAPDQEPGSKPAILTDRSQRRDERLLGWQVQKIKTGTGSKVKPVGDYRNHVANKSKSPNGVWKMSSTGERISAPKLASDIPPLNKDTGGITYTTEEEKQTCLRNSLWSKTNDDGTAIHELRFPDLDPDRPCYEMDQSLDEMTVDRHIRGLPSGKAAGRDGIANEALKMARVIIVPFLTRFLGACLRLSYIPLSFRYAVTVVLPKADKASYNSPKSWRPIALLSSISKLLDRIAADRLKLFAMTHSLLPSSQYGAPGKSTTHALNDMLGVMYQAWSGKKQRKAKRYMWRKIQKATMMGLDMAGAFDSIQREKLLQVLADKGLPEWFIRLMWSFLSQRGTSLRLPCSESPSFGVEIGIPQGSPLSPLLFLFFAAPLLALINENQHPIKGFTICAFAYVDDTYLVAVSNSYAQNCRGLEVVHERIMEWATAADIKFSPPKYSIMHFKCPFDTGPSYTELPDIKGLKDNPDCLKQKVRVLGVVIDPGLAWEDHITHIETKVERSLKHLRNILAATWGVNIQAARQIYLGKVRTHIAYACAVWFVHTPHYRLDWSLKRQQIHRLEKLQYKCLKQVSGALGNPAQRVLEKELHIDSIHVFLYQTMISSRAKSLEIRDRPGYIQDVFVPSKKSGAKRTAYQCLNRDARLVLIDVKDHLLAKKKGNEGKFLNVWKDPKKRKAAINQHAKRVSHKKSAEKWDSYRRERAAKHGQRHHPMALEETWGPESLRLYDGMTRGQSTMLLQCRTEFIGLNYFLNGIKATRPSRDLHRPEETESLELIPAECPCGHRLEAKVGHLDFKRLLTVHGTIAADWAIAYFRLDQFAFPRDYSQFAEDEGEDGD